MVARHRATTSRVSSCQSTSRQLAHDTLPGALTHGYATGILVGGAFYLVGIVIAALTLGVATAPLRSRSVGPHSG